MYVGYDFYIYTYILYRFTSDCDVKIYLDLNKSFVSCCFILYFTDVELFAVMSMC